MTGETNSHASRPRSENSTKPHTNDVPLFSRLATKVAIGFACVSLLLGVTAYVGTAGIHELSETVSFVSGPAWNTADGAMETAIHVEGQMLAVLAIIDGDQSQEAASRLKESHENLLRALKQTIDAGQLGDALAKRVDVALEKFQARSDKVLALNNTVRAAFTTMDEKADLLASLNKTMSCLAVEQLTATVDGVAAKQDATDAETVESETATANEETARIAERAVEGTDSNAPTVAASRALHAISIAHARLLDHQIAMLRLDQPRQAQTPVIEPWSESDQSHVDLVESHPIFQATIPTGQFDDRYSGMTFGTAYRRAFTEYRASSDLAAQAHRELSELCATFEAAGQTLLDVIADAEEIGDGTIDAIGAKLPDRIRTLKRFVLTATLLSFAAAIAASAWFTRLIGRPVTRLISELRYIIGEADLSARLTSDSKDEIGAISREVNGFVANVQQITRETAVNSSSLRSAAETLSRSGTMMSDNATTISGALRQMSDSIREITHGAAESASRAREAAAASREGTTRIEELSSLMDSVGHVVGLIRGVAEQTNLLALNATIEAARAGELGKGFAVVATEVKELAGQTQGATNQIEQRIQQIQGACELLTVSMADIDRVIRTVDEMVQTIAAAVEEQSAVSKQITDQVECNARMAKELSGSLASPMEAAAQIVHNISRIDRSAAEHAICV